MKIGVISTREKAGRSGSVMQQAAELLSARGATVEMIYPDAQSPHVSLSQLARKGGDRATALREIQRVFELSAHPGQDDPWWDYFRLATRDADHLLDDLRRPFLWEGQQ